MNAPLFRLLLLAHLASTFYMVGLIWFVQVVHYPLFGSVGHKEFPDYERSHTALTTWVVGPGMFVEGVTAAILLWLCPAGVYQIGLWFGVFLLAVIWLSTALIQVPCHTRLSSEFDLTTHQRLVRTNWLRTIAWSLRGILVICFAYWSY